METRQTTQKKILSNSITALFFALQQNMKQPLKEDMDKDTSEIQDLDTNKNRLYRKRNTALQRQSIYILIYIRPRSIY